MKGIPNASAKRTQRQYERKERIRAGAPSARHDWQCHICREWYSNYRGRYLMHLRHCERKEARRIAREERTCRAQMAPLPSPDRFPPYYPTLEELSRSPTQDSSIFWDVKDDGLEYLENSDFEPPELNPVLGDSDFESFGEFYCFK
jgi:hypothetical protein